MRQPMHFVTYLLLLIGATYLQAHPAINAHQNEVGLKLSNAVPDTNSFSHGLEGSFYPFYGKVSIACAKSYHGFTAADVNQPASSSGLISTELLLLGEPHSRVVNSSQGTDLRSVQCAFTAS